MSVVVILVMTSVGATSSSDGIIRDDVSGGDIGIVTMPVVLTSVALITSDDDVSSREPPWR